MIISNHQTKFVMTIIKYFAYFGLKYRLLCSRAQCAPPPYESFSPKICFEQIATNQHNFNPTNFLLGTDPPPRANPTKIFTKKSF